ncbi:hypothetical protein [Actinomadura sp. WMMA1423]|uniref:hypothetical protein n=1 Tax=Actinomadura sp. WMMA1423 TaxID=2591108 RepID=UPI0011479182|nr:hypothetical protein [Actinomadura sp. WMMA1423]
MPEQSPTRFTMVPARRSSEPTARRRARRILSALFLAAGLSLVAVVIALAKGSNEPDLSGVDPQGRDLAYTAAVNFLAAKKQDVPHADTFDPEEAYVEQTSGGTGTPLAYRSLSWVGFSPQHFGSEKLGFTDFEVHHFLVVLDAPAQGATQAPSAPQGGRPSSSPSGPASAAGVTATPSAGSTPSPQGSPTISSGPTPSGGDASPSPSAASDVLQLDVTVLLDPSGPRLAAAPGFSVWKNGAGKPKGKGDYTNYGSLSVDVSDASKNQILRWAAAYAAGDSTGLLAVTGDQDAAHRYEGLSGFGLANSSQAVQILSAIKSTDAQLIVRVRLMLAKAQPVGTVSGKKGNVPPFTSFADFDLLVGANGAQPPVLAWGPAGSAADLQPYFNALNN